MARAGAREGPDLIWSEFTVCGRFLGFGDFSKALKRETPQIAGAGFSFRTLLLLSRSRRSRTG
jgi:hypothetical protein